MSEGRSNSHVHSRISEVLRARALRGEVFLDVGCGSGTLRTFVADLCQRYVGVDLVRYESFPSQCDFHSANLDDGLPLPDGFADIVVASEIVEHLENPRALARELFRVTKPGGLMIITTPNQLSLRSLSTLIFRKRFAAFQDVDYPAHLTALLEVDLLRIASEVGLVELGIEYTGHGNIPKTAAQYPQFLVKLWPRGFSDNLILIGTKPH